jgi:hypothetical protein
LHKTGGAAAGRSPRSCSRPSSPAARSLLLRYTSPTPTMPALRTRPPPKRGRRRSVHDGVARLGVPGRPSGRRSARGRGAPTVVREGTAAAPDRWGSGRGLGATSGHAPARGGHGPRRPCRTPPRSHGCSTGSDTVTRKRVCRVLQDCSEPSWRVTTASVSFPGRSGGPAPAPRRARPSLLRNSEGRLHHQHSSGSLARGRRAATPVGPFHRPERE